ncbi:hypothetical protein PVIIG_04120, partial [Plasmodium vivax India VII]
MNKYGNNTLNEELPSSIFDDEFSRYIDLSTLESAALENGDIDLGKWIKQFTEKFSEKYKEIFNTRDKNINAKRCRDLNYHVDYVEDLILQLASKGEHGKKFKIPEDYIKTMKQNMESLFNQSSNYNCTRDDKGYVSEMHTRKALDDFCENRDYLYEHIDDSNNNCDRLTTYVKEKYNCFFNENTCILDPNNGNEKPLMINDTCTLYDIPATFSNFKCKEFKIHNMIQSIPHCPKANMSFFDQALEHIYGYVDYIHDLTSIPKD